MCSFLVVPQSEGVAVGFISISSHVDVKQLLSFELGDFDGFYKQVKCDEAAAAQEPGDEEEEETKSTASQQVIHQLDLVKRS